MHRQMLFAFIGVKVGYDELRELAARLDPLPHGMDAGGFHDVDIRPVVKSMDEFIVVVREQEFPLDVEQRIPQADVILLREALFPDIPVEALCVC